MQKNGGSYLLDLSRITKNITKWGEFIYNYQDASALCISEPSITLLKVKYTISLQMILDVRQIRELKYLSASIFIKYEFWN